MQPVLPGLVPGLVFDEQGNELLQRCVGERFDLGVDDAVDLTGIGREPPLVDEFVAKTLFRRICTRLSVKVLSAMPG